MRPPELEKKNVSGLFTVGGFSFIGQGQNVGMAFVELNDWDERPGKDNSSFAISGRATGMLSRVAGTAVDGPNSYLPAARIVRTPDEARAAVRELKAAGVDFIKVYSSLPKDLYLAVAAEAKSKGIPFVGHVPYPVTAAEASDAGQRSLEHLTEVDVGTSTEETAIKAEEVDAMNQKHGYIPDASRLKSTFDSAKTTALFERFRRNNTWQVPTLVVLNQEREIADSTLQRNDSLLAYIPKLLRDYWRSLPIDIAGKWLRSMDFTPSWLAG